jgi:ribonuclease P protein component
MIIAKRFAAHASTRNALKRVIREAFRHCRLQLPPRDYVVRLHSKVAPASLTALKRAARADADALFARAKSRGPKP